MSAVIEPAAEAMIVAAIHDALGRAPVLLCGSRAVGTAAPDSDYDVLAVVSGLRVPDACFRLRRVAHDLERDLSTAVTVNPLPRFRLDHGRDTLFLWKVRREARVLWAGADFALHAPGPPPLAGENALSYLLTAAHYLMGSLDPADLSEDELPPATERSVRKALLHITQLRLLRSGRYEPALGAALASCDDPGLLAIAADAGRPPAWHATRDALLRDLLGWSFAHRPSRALWRNLQYAGLSALAGTPRWRPVLADHAVEERLAASAVALLRAVGPGGVIASPQLLAAREALPPGLVVEDRSWKGLRDLVQREWACAHPLLGL